MRKADAARSSASGSAPAATRRLTLGPFTSRRPNEQVRRVLEQADDVELDDMRAQRYLGCAPARGQATARSRNSGNDLACYMDGGVVEVLGNAQDQVGNTMNAGEVIIRGRCGDAAGYAMRGGRIFVRDGCGWRAGIHMKEYGEKRPVVVIGRDAGSFLGEYMAGGVVVVLGETGDYLARGMHGGVIYLRKPRVRERCRTRSCSRTSMTPTWPSWSRCSRSTTACSRMSWGMRCAPGVRVPARFARFVSAVREHVRPLIRNRSIEGKGSADMNVPEEFGSLVFDDRAMKATLPAKVYRSLRKTIDEGPVSIWAWRTRWPPP